MKERLVVINKTQFGKNTDSYKWCEYLSQHYAVTYIGFDMGYEKTRCKRVNVRYIPCTRGKWLRSLLFMTYTLGFLLFFRGKILIVWFQGCELYKRLLPFRHMILNVRSLSITRDKWSRQKKDEKIYQAARLFDQVTVISNEMRSKFSSRGLETDVFPITADVISETDKTFDTLRLLYLGVLSGRDLKKTLWGLQMFVNKYPDRPISYTIVGGEQDNTYREIERLIIELGLSQKVRMHKEVSYIEVKHYLDEANIGVSFIPQTEYYDCQPPTKTFEYILSGLFCLATNTKGHRIIIDEKNGYLHEASAQGFLEALEYVYQHRENMQSSVIRSTLLHNTWKEVINKALLPIIGKLK